MAWTAPRTYVDGETITKSILDVHVRDNLNALMVVTTKGDLAVATASVTLTRLPIGSAGAVLVADATPSMGMRWSSTGKTASAGAATNVLISNTLTAAANSDTLHQLYSAPIIAKGAFTGLVGTGLIVDAATATGAGIVATFYGAYFAAQTIGTTNWSVFVAGGNNYFGTGLNFINDTANAQMTTGLTINQGAADNEILALKSGDVAHGMTNFAETDTFFSARKRGATAGGVLMYALAGAGVGLNLQAFQSTASTTKSTAATATIMLGGGLQDGTTSQSLGANANILTIDDNGTVRFIFDADGDSHQDVGTAWTNFDRENDIALLNTLAAHVTRKDDPLRRGFGKWLREKRGRLEELKLVTFNRDGHHFVNMSRLTMLHTGALRELGARLEAQAERLLLLEKKVLQLSA